MLPKKGLNEMKIGILGAGRVAQHYLSLLKSEHIKSAEVTSVCDIDRSKADFLAQQLDCRPYYDIESFVSEGDFDLAFVLTPSGHHFAHASYLVENKKHLLVEKPVCMRVDDAIELEKLASKNSVVVSVGFQNRFNKASKLIKSKISQNGFGKLVSFSVRLRWCRFQDYYEDGWHGTWAMDGGVINQQAIHHIDMMSWTLGPIKRVCAIAKNRLNSLEAEDTLVAIVELANGAIGTLEATTATRPDDIEASIAISGELGYATIGGRAINEVCEWKFADEDEMRVKADHSEDVDSGYGFSHFRLINELIASISEGKSDHPNTIPETLESLRLVHSIYASIEHNRWVDLDENMSSQFLGVK